MTYRDRPDGYDMQRWANRSLEQRKRRPGTKWLLGFGLLIVIGSAILAVVAPGDDDRHIPNLFPLAMPLILGASLSPFARSPWLTARGRARYDEFERAAYARATALAYTLFVGLAAATLGYLWAANAWGWPAPQSPRAWSFWFFALLLTGAGLPLLLAEIMVPLPPPAEDWED